MTRSKSSRKGGCPTCGKAPRDPYSPFCSKHCSDVDLGRWMTGQYAIPGEPVPQEALPPEDDGNQDR